MDLMALEKLGLTPNEAKTYVAFAKGGTQTAGSVAKKIGLHRSRIYQAIERLIQIGLLNFTLVNGIKYFNAKNPSALVDLANERKAEILKLVPMLQPMREDTEDNPNVEAYQGKSGVKALLNETLQSVTYNVFGAPQKSVPIMGETYWENYNQKINASKIKTKLLFNEDLREWSKVIKSINEHTTIKFLKRRFDSITQTFVFRDKVIIIIWTSEPFGIAIRDSFVAKAYNQFFEILWKEAER